MLLRDGAKLLHLDRAGVAPERRRVRRRFLLLRLRLFFLRRLFVRRLPPRRLRDFLLLFFLRDFLRLRRLFLPAPHWFIGGFFETGK